jgi:hypothetical protein
VAVSASPASPRAHERRQIDPYATVERFCLFVGYPRSGHSLVGSLLDAHPDVVIAHEANALKLATADGLTRPDLFAALVESARQQAERPGGRRASGYSYVVPGQWQGRFRSLRVIGDKSGQKVASRIGRDPDALSLLERVVDVPLRLVHVTRNPFDTIARIALERETKRGEEAGAVGRAIDFYGRLTATTARLLAGGRFTILTVRHESFVQNTRGELRSVCAFLGVEAGGAYLDACAQIVLPAPLEARHLVTWSRSEHDAVDDLIARHAFLDGYSWEGAAVA